MSVSLLQSKTIWAAGDPGTSTAKLDAQCLDLYSILHLACMGFCAHSVLCLVEG